MTSVTWRVSFLRWSCDQLKSCRWRITPRSNFINFVSSLFLINYIFYNYVCLDIFSYIWIHFTFGYTEFVGLDILYLWTHFFLLLDTLNIWIFISINENIQISWNIQTSSISKWQPPVIKNRQAWGSCHKLHFYVEPYLVSFNLIRDVYGLSLQPDLVFHESWTFGIRT